MIHETPAAKVVRLLGAKRIAARCDLTTGAVEKWPGHIPSRHQPAVLELASELNVPLTAADVIGVRS